MRSSIVTIKYAPDSLVLNFSKREMESMKRMMQLDLLTFEFDPSYVEHIQHFHGGKPVQKFFRTTSGKCLPIDRFLNYGNLNLLDQRELKDLNVNVAWPMISGRLNIYLLPFAVVANGDFLCFDYGAGLLPSVVLWVQELSEEDEPFTEYVAGSFNNFLYGLTENFQA